MSDNYNAFDEIAKNELEENNRMLDTEIKNSPYIDLRIGVKFYFYKNPINCKKAIKEIFDSYCNITRTSFFL